MSSSTSGQWIPWPPPISRKLARWPEVASESRQDQAKGTLMTRPSARHATISSFVTRTSRIRGSPPAAVVIPRLHDLLVMLSNDLADPSQLVCCKPMVSREHQRVQPELARAPVSLHVDVGRLVAIEAGEEEPIRSGDAPDAWHPAAPTLPSRCHPGLSSQAANANAHPPRTPRDCPRKGDRSENLAPAGGCSVLLGAPRAWQCAPLFVHRSHLWCQH